MSNPAVLWIRRLEDGFTARMGTSAHLSERCQFMGYVVAPSSLDPLGPLPKKKSRSKAHPVPAGPWYAVLHRFKLSGAYVGTDSWCADTAPVCDGKGKARAEARLALWLGQLRYVSFQDIHIRPFTVTIDGHEFGLLREGSSRVNGSLRLVPANIVFASPWDGYAAAEAG